MRLSTRGRYGLKAMIDLAVHAGEGPVPLKAVAERQRISEHYLEQLMGSLRKAGLVVSVRGAQGGYVLGREAERITAGDIIRALEGPIAPVECVDESGATPCDRVEQCVTYTVWRKLRDAMVEVLDGLNLAELAEDARRRVDRATGPPMYYI
ncbi:MAG TPA: Rrf2 family transcriptional regulator [Firmicutes bacterium]|nr:Rrf2 family transcriptional regulator [Bacillota bacterium]